MTLLAVKPSVSAFGDTTVEGDVHVLSKWFHRDQRRDQRTANLAGAIIGPGAQVTIIQPAEESPAIKRAKERAEREITLINEAHELLALIRNPDVSTKDKIFNDKVEQLFELMGQIQKTTRKPYYRKSDNLVDQDSTIRYVERLDKDFKNQSKDVILYCRNTGYATNKAEAKFKAPGMPRLLFFIWSLDRERHGIVIQYPKSCAIL